MGMGARQGDFRKIGPPRAASKRRQTALFDDDRKASRAGKLVESSHGGPGCLEQQRAGQPTRHPASRTSGTRGQGRSRVSRERGSTTPLEGRGQFNRARHFQQGRDQARTTRNNNTVGARDRPRTARGSRVAGIAEPRNQSSPSPVTDAKEARKHGSTEARKHTSFT